VSTNYAIYDTALGFFRIDYEYSTLVGLSSCKTFEDMGTRTTFSDSVIGQLEEYFRGDRKEFSINYKLYGTPFQMRVWKALECIPYGVTKSYKDIAISINNENASRAVGGANNKNPIGIIVPCHRVIGANNKLVGYAGGLELKKKLLEIEKRNM